MRLTVVFKGAIAALALLATAGGAVAFDLTPPARSFEAERAMAAGQHEQVMAQFGGEYENETLARYVTEVGNRAAASSDMPDKPFTFTVLNSPVVNAFTVGGGYVYVTRGILASINSEAELAALLGHEIGHVTARHTSRRETRMEQDRAVSVGIGLLTGRLSSALIAEGLSALNRQAYSRGQEAEADTLGVETLDRAGYDPFAMAEMLGALKREVGLMQKMAGDDGGGLSIPAWLSDHPETDDRIEKTTREAQATGKTPGAGELGRDRHMAAIDGALFGPDPRFGLRRDGLFIHPELQIAFEIPDSYQMQRMPGALVALRDESSFLLFTGGQWPQDRSLAEFALSAWYSVTEGDAGDLDTLDETEINGLPAVIVTKQVRRRFTQGTLASVAYRTDSDIVFSLSFMVSGELTKPVFDEFKAIANSFRPVTDAEIAAIPIPTVEVVEVKAGDTLESLAEQMLGGSFRLDRLKALNGIETLPEPGTQLKLIVDGRS